MPHLSILHSVPDNKSGSPQYIVYQSINNQPISDLLHKKAAHEILKYCPVNMHLGEHG